MFFELAVESEVDIIPIVPTEVFRDLVGCDWSMGYIRGSRTIMCARAFVGKSRSTALLIKVRRLSEYLRD